MQEALAPLYGADTPTFHECDRHGGAFRLNSGAEVRLEITPERAIVSWTTIQDAKQIARSLLRIEGAVTLIRDRHVEEVGRRSFLRPNISHHIEAADLLLIDCDDSTVIWRPTKASPMSHELTVLATDLNKVARVIHTYLVAPEILSALACVSDPTSSL